MAINTDFWFKFKPSKFLAETAYLTLQEKGAFITLLCHQFQSGAIPDKTICFLLGSDSLSIFEALKPMFKQDSAGRWFNEELQEMIAERSQVIETKREAGKKGGRPKKQTESIPKPDALPYDKPYDKANRNHLNSSFNSNSSFEFEKLKKVLLDFQNQADRTNASTFHDDHYNHLKRNGFDAQKEVVVSEGRVDIVVYLKSGNTVGIELDNKSPRHKSRVKLENFDFSVMILRGNSHGDLFPEDYDLFISPQIDRSSNLPAIQPADTTPLDPAIIAGFAHNRISTSEGIIVAPNPTSCPMPQSWGENPAPELWADELHKIWKECRVEESGTIGRFTYIQIGAIGQPARDIWDNALWYLAGKVVTKTKIFAFKTYWDGKHYETDWKSKYQQLPEVQKIILKATQTERDNQAAWEAVLAKEALKNKTF